MLAVFTERNIEGCITGAGRMPIFLCWFALIMIVPSVLRTNDVVQRNGWLASFLVEEGAWGAEEGAEFVYLVVSLQMRGAKRT